MAYEKKLKRGKDGRISRHVGTQKGGNPVKFYLGFDLPEAEKRIALIIALWEANCLQNETKIWTDRFLSEAKEIAKGGKPVLPPTASDRIDRDAMEYLVKLQNIADKTGEEWGAYEREKQAGITDTKNLISEKRQVLGSALGLEKSAEITGTTLEQALQKFQDVILKEYTLPDDSISPTGKSLYDEIETVRRYLPTAYEFSNGKKKQLDLLNLDLGMLGLTECQHVFDVIRSRPVSERTGRRFAVRTAKNTIKALARFFDWLDTSAEMEWSEPPKFRKLKKIVDPQTGDEKFAEQQAKEISVIPSDHLQIISRYCIDNERVLLLLGLNCAFGEGETGQLRTTFIKGNEIRGIRFKTGNETRHLLWDETVEALKNTIAKRPVINPDHQIVFVAASGQPLWKRTKSGNYSNGVSNTWYRLMQRVRKDHPELPPYSYNKLRKTSAQAILRHCSAESASMILAHKTISDDELLECYVQMPWDKLFEAQKKWGEEILPLIKAPEEKIKVGGGALSLKQAEQLRELFEQGKSKVEIARLMQVSHMTVYRYLK